MHFLKKLTSKKFNLIQLKYVLIERVQINKVADAIFSPYIKLTNKTGSW